VEGTKDLAMNGYPLKIAGMSVQEMTGSPAAEMEVSDNTLIRQVLSGRIKPFRKLVQRYQKQAYLYARSMVGNADDAYDLSQEAFVRVYRHLNRFDSSYPFKVWFFHILSNLCKNHLRQRKNRQAVTTSTDMMETVAAPKSQRPDIVFQKIELQQKVWEGIAELSEKFREIIVLCHFQDMSYEQLAKVLDIPRGSVMSRLYYARQKLREILENKGVAL
jgi:RNA polymerase sigma-70 factor (ECF subfamily)